MTPTTNVVAVAEGAQATFTVALSGAPGAPVTVTLTSSNTAVTTVSPATLTFSAANFATAQTVTVQGVQDADTVNATANVVLAGGTLANVTVRVDVTDDDLQAILAMPTTLTVPEGLDGQFTVKLAAAPAAPLTIAVTSATTGKATAAPATLTFTAANFGTAQTVTVTALQDPDVVDEMVNVTLTSMGLPTITVPVTITDDDRQGITVSPAAITIIEGSATAGTFQVHLNQMPSSPVTVNLASMNVAAATVSPATLTFTSANYLTDQAASVLAVSDDNTLDESTTINVTSAGLTSRVVTVAVTDDDHQAISVLPTSVTVAEGGSSTFSVRLAFNPSSAVSVSIASANATKATTTVTSLTFTAANFATPQTVTVQGQPDDDLANESVTLTLTSPGATSVTVPVTVTDDDVQALIVTPTTLGVIEGSTATFTARLAFRPAAAVTVTAATSAPLVATVGPASLTFSPAAFATPQTFTVSGEQDVDVVDGTATVTVASTSVPSVPVAVTVTDDDRQAILAAPSNLGLTEGGAAGALQVRLNFAPTVTTTVNVVSSNAKVTVVPSTLTFSPANFSTTQAVMVSAANDADAIDEVAALTFSAAGITDSVVNVTVTDVDTQLHVVAPSSLTVMEQDPTGGTFTVHLSAQPLANVTVTIASSAPGAASVTPATLIFTPGNYGVDQPVVVRGVSDPNLTDEQVTVTVSSTVAPTASIMVLVQDDDLQDLVVTPAGDVQPNVGSLVVVEDAATPATIAVSLAFQPSGTKGIRVASNNASVQVNGQAFVDLVFTTTNYGTPQILTVTTPSDNNLDQPTDTTVSVNLCDTACSSSTFSTIKIVNVDAREDDVQQIITSESTIPIGENPANNGTFTARLAFEPLGGGSETVTVTSSDTGAATASPPTLVTFTAGNYAVPQTITVSGVDDADVNNETVTTTLHSSFASTADATVTVNVTDDDTQAILLSSNSTMLQEPPGSPVSDTFMVHMQFDPAGTLVVALTSPDPGAVTVSPATLTFTSANYMVPQTVTVTALSDEDVRDEVVAITASAPAVQTVTYTASVTDDDAQGLVTVASASVIEGSTALVPVHLQFQPTNDFTVTATLTGPAAKASVSGPVTFNAGNYATDQNFTITGLMDGDLDDASLTLTLAVTSAQGTGAPEGAPSVVMGLTVFDSDVQSMVVSWSPAAPFVNSVQELGPDGSFQVHLVFPPRGLGDDVVQALLPAGLVGHVVIVGPTSLVFTDGNFNVDQTVRFRAIQDADVLDDAGDIHLFIDEQADPSGPNLDVTALAPVRLIDRQRGIISSVTDSSLLGGTQFTERGNIQWGSTSFLLTGHNASGVFSVGRDDRDLGTFALGPTVGTANADGTTQSIEWNGSNFGVFVSDRIAAAVRFTQVSPLLEVVGASTTFGAGASEFWVTNNTAAQRYAVLYRAASDNLNFSLVQYDGTQVATQIVTSPDLNPDRSPNIHYVGGTTGLDYAYTAVTTPYVALYTTSGGLVCLRLTATGALVPGGNTVVNMVQDFYSSVWTGGQVAAAHTGAGGLDIELINLSSSGTACTRTTVNGPDPDSYVSVPSIAFNGVELAVGYDVSRIIDSVGTSANFVGVYLYNPTTHAASNRLFNASGDVPGERPSLTWAGDRWIMRYSSAAGVQVRTGSFTP